MRNYFGLLIIILLFVSVSCKEKIPRDISVSTSASVEQQPVISVVDVATFEKGLQDNVQLIDVRTDREWEQGHLKGAKHFEINNPQWEEQIENLDKSKPVYVYCAKGGRSARSAKQLMSAGFTQIIDLDGGITAWQKAGKPIE